MRKIEIPSINHYCSEFYKPFHDIFFTLMNKSHYIAVWFLSVSIFLSNMQYLLIEIKVHVHSICMYLTNWNISLLLLTVEETPVISSQPAPSTAEPVTQTLHEQKISPELSPPQIPPEVPLEGITVVKEHSHGMNFTSQYN